MTFETMIQGVNPLREGYHQAIEDTHSILGSISDKLDDPDLEDHEVEAIINYIQGLKKLNGMIALGGAASIMESYQKHIKRMSPEEKLEESVLEGEEIIDDPAKLLRQLKQLGKTLSEYRRMIPRERDRTDYMRAVSMLRELLEYVEEFMSDVYIDE